MAFQQLIFRIQRPMESMTHLLPVFVNSLTSAERLIELEELEQEDIDNPTMFTEPMGIRFDDVCYRYNERGRLVIEHFSHDFKPGSFTAILGATGAGKTTLIRLMLSLINPTSGDVLAYSRSKCEKATPNIRCNFSYVPQGNSLFSGTIRDNLRLSNPDATTEDMNKQEEFRDRTYLNPEITNMFHALGLIESYGSGIRRATHAMADNGNPPLLFEPLNDTDDYTMVTCPINEEFAHIRDHEDEASKKTSEKTTTYTHEISEDTGLSIADLENIKLNLL